MTLLAALATGAGAPIASPAVRAVADRVGVSRNGAEVVNQTTYVSTHTVRRTVTKLRASFGGHWFGTADETIDIDGAALVIGGTVHPLTFSAAPGATIAPGDTLVSDWLEVDVTAGTAIQSRTCYAANTYHPQHQWELLSGGVTGRPTAPFGNYTTSGSGAVPVDNGIAEYGRGPLIIEGETVSTGPSVALLGDSIVEGKWDTDINSKVGGEPRGFLAIAMHDNDIPWTLYGVNADQAPGAGITREGRFGDTIPAHTHALCEYGINSINGVDSTFAGVAGGLLQFWQWVTDQGPEVWQTTITPSNTSTDSWATLGNQTVGPREAVRVAVNDWIRDGAPLVSGVAVAAGSSDPSAVRAGDEGHPLAGYIEVADTVESSRNSGKWKVNGVVNYLTDDGIHPSPAAHQLMAAPVSARAATL